MNDPKAKPAAQGEPSMEEILASIRRIISEDGEPAKPAAAPATAPVASAPAPIVVPPAAPVITAVPPPAPVVAAPILPVSDVLELTEVVEERVPPPKPAPVVAPAVENDDNLVSVNVAAAATGSLSSLMSAKRQTERGMSDNPLALGNPGATLESIVREELRPILKAWLDQNLTPMVERMVQREIQRIARNIE